MVIVALPAAASAQHGAGRTGSSGGMQHGQMIQQQQMMHQQMLFEQQMMHQQMLLEQQMMQQMQRQPPLSGQRQGMMQQQPSRQQGMTQQAQRQQPTPGQLALPKAVNSNRQQPAASRQRATKMQRRQGKPDASGAQASPEQQPAPMSPSNSQHVSKRTPSAKESKDARERIERAMEKEVARRIRRREAFLRYLLENGILAANAAWLQPNASFSAFDDWVARQEALRAEGLATEAFYAHFLAFQAGYSVSSQ
jgi:hypothetical protein